ncbi:MAG: hypothetical protein JWO63_2105 [Frankiales bacterium]|nr:hypothetical protein [Frankiales bacterium]
MRKSTKLAFAAAAVAVGFIAIGSTSASTASNTVPNSVAGFGEGTVTGATVTAIHYVTDTADPSKLDSVVFDSSTDITGTTVTMTLKDGSLAIIGSPYACSYTPYAAGATTITCLTADLPATANLGATDLTVVNS